MSKSTGKLKSLTLEEKLKLIELVEDGRSVREVAEEHEINKNTLHYILKNRGKIRERICLNPNVSGNKRIKDAKSPELEQRILEFMHVSRNKNQKLSGNIIKAVALQIADELGVDSFAGSNGWLFSFLKRNRITISDFNKGVDQYKDQAKELPMLESIAEEEFNIEVVDYEEDADYTTEQEIDELPNEEVELADETEELELLENRTDDVPIALRLDEPSWRNWCRLCGHVDSQYEVNLGDEEGVRQIFNISSDEIRACENCNFLLSEISKTLSRSSVVEDVMRQLEEREKIGTVTESVLSEVRREYGLDYNDPQLDTEYLEEEQANDEEYYEEDQLTEQDECEEVIYEDEVMDRIELAHEERIEIDLSEESTIPSEENVKPNASLKRSAIEDSFTYKCHVCSEVFSKMCFLANHTRTCHSCLPKVACTCGRLLSTWDSLMAHHRKHSPEEKMFVCDLCNASFLSKTGLTIHVKFKHEKPVRHFICPTCDRTFKDPNTLKAHIRTHLPHDQKYSFECEICGKRMVNKWSLKYHILTIHEKVIQHFCHLCGRGFGNKSNLRSHVISHSTENVSCEICGGTFKNRISLQSHKKIHKPESLRKFGCDVCHRKFHNQNHLRRHLISHSEERQFKCPYEFCANEYKWQKDLNNHIIGVHTGEKPHKCIFCDRSFVDGANLRKHKVKEHAEELAAYELEFGKGRRKENRITVKYEAE